MVVGLNTTLAEQLAEAARDVPHVLLLMAKSLAFVPPIVTLLMVTDDFVVFVNVADCAALVDPTAVLGKLREVGDAVTLPLDVLPPVPDSATVCGLFEAVSETVRVAARVPVVLGLNATDTLQLADAARLDPQVLLVIVKSPGLVPVTATLLMVIDEVVPFFRVAVCAVLVEPTLTVPNEKDVGLMLTEAVLPVAVPERATV